MLPPKLPSGGLDEYANGGAGAAFQVPLRSRPDGRCCWRLGFPGLAGRARRFRAALFAPCAGIADQLGWLYAQHGVQMVLALIAIAVMKWLVPADYGLHAPEDRSYVGTAILWGLLFGALMAVVRSAPDLLNHAVPKLDYPLSPANVAGRLGFEGVYAGPTEEILFRSLLATFLAATMPGRWRVGNYEMNGSGVRRRDRIRFVLRGFPGPADRDRVGPSLGLLSRARRALRLLAGEIRQRPGSDRGPQRRRPHRIRAALPHGGVLGLSANASASNSYDLSREA